MVASKDALTWRTHIIEGYASRAHESRPEFKEGVSSGRLDEIEKALDVRIPRPLRDLLQETDGVDESLCINGEWMVVHAPVWTCDEIVAENESILRNDPSRPRSPAAPDARPFYFADAGVDGIVFAFFVGVEQRDDPGVYGYDPMDREWTRISPSLEEHLRGWTL